MPAVLRYAVAVLALVAIGLTATLAWETFGKETLIGCAGGDIIGCDEVLGSGWSKFLGMPVALGGLFCYTAIFVLSLSAGTRNESAARVINTLLALMALLAVGAGVWFTSLQFIAIGKICPRCLTTHVCGLIIFSLTLATLFRGQGHSPRRVPSAAAVGISTSPQRLSGSLLSPAGPSWGIAGVGALVILGLLVGGQVLFRPATFQVSTAGLDETIELSSDATPTDRETDHLSPNAQQHVVNRLEPDENAGNSSFGDHAAQDNVANDTSTVDEESVRDERAEQAPAIGETADVDAQQQTREVALLDGKLKFDIYKQAVLGSPEAPYVVVELIDYTCPHCRQMNQKIEAAFDRYGSDQLAVVIMPAPLELECNKVLPATDPMHRGACRLARLALSVAAVKLSAFRDFHNWLMDDVEEVPPISKAVLRAFKAVDRKKLTALTDSDEINNRIQKHLKLFSALVRREPKSDKSLGLPIQVVGNTVLFGRLESAEEMFEQWEIAMDIRPK